MFPYVVVLLLTLKKIPTRLATLPYGVDSNVTKLFANLLNKSSVFHYLPIILCNFVSIKIIIIIKQKLWDLSHTFLVKVNGRWAIHYNYDMT